MDLDKLNKLSPKLKERAILEELEYIPISFIQFTNNRISNYSLNEIKAKINADVTPRVLNNWIDKKVINVDSSDKGRIKRFNTLENIWLKIVVDLRKIGLPLDSLKYIRTQLFDYTIDDFCLFKFKVLQVILGNPEYFIIDDNHEVGFYSYEYYAKKVAKGHLFSHINMRFIDFVRLEFPLNNFHFDFGIRNLDEDVDKVSLLFFLKTNEFTEIRITLADGDTRLIKDSNELKVNKELLKVIQNWEFESIIIQTKDGEIFNIDN
jgi:hypothetical protein